MENVQVLPAIRRALDASPFGGMHHYRVLVSITYDHTLELVIRDADGHDFRVSVALVS